MKSLHRISGILISIFIVCHLANHLSALWGIEMHQEVLDNLRVIYRVPLIETLLIASFLFQSISGIILFWSLFKKKNKHLWDYLKMYSGLVLGLFIVNHIAATIGQRIYFNLDTNFYFAARVVIQKPWLYFFIPYYFLGIMSLAVHVASIHRIKIMDSIGIKRANIHFFLICFVFLIVAISILAVFTGGCYDIHIPDQYNVY